MQSTVSQDIDAALENASQQIEVKQYQTELKENGSDPVYTLVIVSQGKTIKQRHSVLWLFSLVLFLK